MAHLRISTIATSVEDVTSRETYHPCHHATSEACRPQKHLCRPESLLAFNIYSSELQNQFSFILWVSRVNISPHLPFPNKFRNQVSSFLAPWFQIYMEAGRWGFVFPQRDQPSNMHRNIQARRVRKVMLVDKTWYYAWAPGLLHRTSIFPWFFTPYDQNRTWGFLKYLVWLTDCVRSAAFMVTTHCCFDTFQFCWILFINQMCDLCWIGNSKPWWKIWCVESVNLQRYTCPDHVLFDL